MKKDWVTWNKVVRLFENGPVLGELATVDRHGHPRVRDVMCHLDDKMVLRIPTKKGSRKVKEIEAVPHVHLLVGKDLFARSAGYAQIDGMATLTQHPAVLKRFWTDSLRHYFSGPEDPEYLLIEIRPTRIEYWSLAQEKNPQIMEEESFSAILAGVDEAEELREWDPEDEKKGTDSEARV